MSTLPTYEFGPYKLDAAERLLRRGDRIVPLTLKAFETLLVLVKNGGRIIEKEELLNAVWAESFVEEATLAQNVFTLRKTLGRDEGGRSYIETIQRRGYRFVAPVRVSEKRDAAGAGQRAPTVARPAASAAADRRGHNAVAVLALDNACEDPYVDYLSDGITESIINNLSRLPSLRVMSRSTILQFRGKGIDPQEAGRQLGVPAVLTGRVLRLDSQMIIRVELIDVQHGWQIWGEQYNREISDIFRIQEEVANQITESLRSIVVEVEEQPRAARDTQSVEAYELYLKGRYHWSKRSTDGYRRAKEYFEKAIHIDPEFSLAYSGYADAGCSECASAGSGQRAG